MCGLIGYVGARPAQARLVAYPIARLRGLDVDRPRNLVRTVTVE